MIRHLSVFLATFVVGALVTLGARAARHQPHAGATATALGGGDYAAMVSNPLAPAVAASTSSAATEPAAAPTPATTPTAPAADAATTPAPATGASGAHDHSGHGAAPASDAPTTDANQPVNTRCAICGMPVDPTVPTATYQGKTIGFGCRMCPPKFKADPDRYGPLYLRNEVVKR